MYVCRERFHPFTPGQHLTYRISPHGGPPDWYAKYNPDLKIGETTIVYIRIYVYVNVYVMYMLHICKCICYIYAHADAPVYPYISLYVYPYMYIPICISLYVYPYMYIPVYIGVECCSVSSVSFHYVKADLMLAMHAYLYACMRQLRQHPDTQRDH
jgi:hypothetical protein